MRALKYWILTIALCLGISAKAQKTVNDIPAPEGFTRVSTSGFGAFLRGLPLKPEGSPVVFYNGERKYWQGGAFRVVDWDVRSEAEQCADVVMHLRAEYLWRAKRYGEIHFNFTNGFRAEYTRWAEGERISVHGNKASWYQAAEKDYSHGTFKKYLNMVYNYAGTASLSKELASVSLADVKIGDVFIHGGHPGHGMIIVDMAEDGKGRKAIMVVQGYMPAQSIHIVTNPGKSFSPWYVFDENTKEFSFPEWGFNAGEIKRFR